MTKEEITRSKPAPETFLRAAEKIRLTPACCAVVEDAVPGVQAAKAAGTQVHEVSTAEQAREVIRDVLHSHGVKLLAKGKVFKVALTACMRKLLTMLNACPANVYQPNSSRSAGTYFAWTGASARGSGAARGSVIRCNAYATGHQEVTG